MYPTLFEIGNFKLHTYGAMIIIAFLAAYALARKRAPGFGVPPAKLLDISLWTLFAGVIGARLVYIGQHWGYYSENRHELFSLQFQGLTSFGGLIFGGLVFLLLVRRQGWDLRRMIDLVMPSYILGHAIGRIGCLLNACCHGGPTDLPWGVHQHGLEGPHHPAQAYDTLMNLVVLGVMLKVEPRLARPGMLAGLGLALHGVTRFIYEFWRAGHSSVYAGSLPVTPAQIMAAVVSLVGVGLMAWFGRQSRTTG